MKGVLSLFAIWCLVYFLINNLFKDKCILCNKKRKLKFLKQSIYGFVCDPECLTVSFLTAKYDDCMTGNYGKWNSPT